MSGVEHVPAAAAGKASPRSWRSGKRALDVIVASVVLALTLPLMAVIALAIVIESPGPVFYRAQRVGFRGRPLAMLKFRKMHAEARGSPITVRADARLTRVGALLTATRLDELPQFWHVLHGEMSLVGPRPEDPGLVRCRAEDFRHIVRVRPGITGFAQIAFRDERGILPEDDPVGYYVDRLLPQKCALDRLYACTHSLRTDLCILGWTVVTVLFRRPVAVDRQTGRLSVRRRPAERARPAEPPVTGVARSA
jgi:lipopolysaccharide/colanic/teichoic acid biosynthesis glycosyltransferase